MSLTYQTISKININSHFCDFTSVILKCNPLDGLYQSLILLKKGYQVTVVDFTQEYSSVFIRFKNCSYFSRDFEKIFEKLNLNKSEKSYEAFCVVVSQFVNQIHKSFSLLCCGINKTRLETASQHKYGEKGDKNFIGHLTQDEVISELKNEFHIESNFYVNYTLETAQSNSHKFRYPLCFLHDIKRTENAINLNEIKHPTTLHPMTDNISNLLHEFNFEQGFYDQNWPERFIEEKLNKLEAYCIQNDKYNLNLAISGGIDSSVTLMILKKLEERNPKFKVNAFTIPISSTEGIQNRARELCKTMNYSFEEINLTDYHKEFCDYLCQEMEKENIPLTSNRDYVYGCTKSNLRGFTMVNISLNNNGLIIGTGNKDEDVFLKFFSVYGDGFVDVSFMGDVPKFCVYILGNYLKVPDDILYASPSPDLMTTNNSDEEEMGTSYEYASIFLFLLENPVFARSIIEKYKFTEEDNQLFKNHFSKILDIRRKSYHKSVKPENTTNPNVGFYNKDSRAFSEDFQFLNEDEFDIETALEMIKKPVYIYYSGFFSAITKAHLEIAEKAILSQEGYVVLVLSPAPKSYTKPGYEWLSYETRVSSCNIIKMEMTRKHNRRNMKIIINEEKSSGQFLGTYYYLNEFVKRKYLKKSDLIFLCGSDNFENIISGNWLNSQELLREYNFMIVGRNSKKFQCININDSSSSSSEILNSEKEEFVSHDSSYHNNLLRIIKEIFTNPFFKEFLSMQDLTNFKNNERIFKTDDKFRNYLIEHMLRISSYLIKIRKYKNSATMFNDYYKITMCKLIMKMHKNVTVAFSVDLRSEEDRENALLRKDEIFERLTDLKNRRFFEEMLPQELQELQNFPLVDEVVNYKFEGETDKVIVSVYVAYDYKLEKERLFIESTGPWFRVTWVETPLMQSVYSLLTVKHSLYTLLERCFKSINLANNVDKKCCLMSGRRTDSMEFLLLQNMMMCDLYDKEKYLGTSSIDCRKILFENYPIKNIGTSGHELQMVFACLYSEYDQNLPLSSLYTHYCLHKEENEKICILPDTISSDSFLRAMQNIKINGQNFSEIVSKARHDSGDIEKFCELFPEFDVISTEISYLSDLERLQQFDSVKSFGAGGFFGDSNKVHNDERNVNIAVKVVRVYHEQKVMYAVKLSDDYGKESVDTSIQNYKEIVDRYEKLALNCEFDVVVEQEKFNSLIA